MIYFNPRITLIQLLSRLVYQKRVRTGIALFSTVMLFAQSYHGCKGNIYFVRKVDPDTIDLLGCRINVAASICAKVPKYFSRGHKAKVGKLTENLLFDRISPA